MAVTKDETTLLLGAGALAILYFGLIRPVTNKLGLTQSDKDRREAEMVAEASRNAGWDPAFWKKPTPFSHKFFTAATATALAKRIGDAWGVFNDDEQAIFTVFRSLQSQAQLSEVVDYYARLYNQDLLTRLKAPWYYAKDGLDDSEFKIIADIVNRLPAYLKA